MSLRDELGEDYGEDNEEEARVEEEVEVEEEIHNNLVDEDLIVDQKREEKKVLPIEYATEEEKESLVLTPLIRSTLKAKRLGQLMSIRTKFQKGCIPINLLDILPQLRFDSDTIIPPEELFETMDLDEIIEREIYERSIPIIVEVILSSGAKKHYHITDFEYDGTKRGDPYSKRKHLYPGRK